MAGRRPRERVLPAWSRSLSPTMEAYDWAETGIDALNDCGSHRTDELLAAACAGATPEQRQTLHDFAASLLRSR